MKKLIALALFAFGCATVVPTVAADRRFPLSSPDGTINVDIRVGEDISFAVKLDGRPVVERVDLSVALRDRVLGKSPVFKGKRSGAVDEVLRPHIPMKFSEIDRRYNYLTLDFADGYSVEFRAFDTGVAYRFVTELDGKIDILDEEFAAKFAPSSMVHIQPMSGGFRSSCEEPYEHLRLGDWSPLDKMSTLPLLVESDGAWVLISESGLLDYAGMQLKGDGNGGVRSIFAHYPLETRPYVRRSDRRLDIVRSADYIVRTDGTRLFPWRYFAVSRDLGGIALNTLTTQLAPESAVEDLSWVRPGQVVWEWWNGAVVYGPDVDFVSGQNTATYKYYIDFAAEHGIPYLLLDEGWAADTRNPFEASSRVDIPELVKYGKERGVGLFLWLSWLTVEENFDLFRTFADWGVKGVKIDFMDRSDQWMVNFYERVASAAAANRLLVAFHGAYKPSGLEGKYPNVLAYEGVRGMEFMDRCLPSNSIWLPFMRNAVGPMDYTPGAMVSMQPEVYASKRPNAASIGTRAYQMALYTLFETGFQMLADNPSIYKREAECTDFISRVPVTWDETRVLAADAGRCVAVAKRKGTTWFVAAVNGDNRTDWRKLELTFDFLDKDATYDVTSVADGINAPQQAMDYRIVRDRASYGDKRTLRLARNGGWTARFERR
ncbi:MAG: glycoside hydrolase family 97 protein [Alistipes sp.]|nr:glycoside hydrolase family 97 protein [Alistipes sp.]